MLDSQALQNLTEDRVRTVLDAFTSGRWHAAVVPERVPSRVPGSDPGSSPNAPLHIAGSFLSLEQQLQLPPQGPLFAFQPIVDFQNRRISSYEALLRGPAGEPPHQVLGEFQGRPCTGLI